MIIFKTHNLSRKAYPRKASLSHTINPKLWESWKYENLSNKKDLLIETWITLYPNKLLLERLVCLWKNIRIIQASVWKIVCFKDYHFKEALFIWLKLWFKEALFGCILCGWSFVYALFRWDLSFLETGLVCKNLENTRI